MADAEKTDVKEDDNISEMEDELPVCCFAFELICCPQKYWNVTGKESDAVTEEKEGEKEEDKEEKKEDK